MIYIIMSNLEPIEGSDLDLESKLKEGRGELSRREGTGQPIKAENEVPKEIISSEKDNAYGKILSKIQAQPPADVNPEEVEKDAANVFQKTDAESQIQRLIDIAMAKGVIHAVKVARHLEDNYVIDMFHDKILADEFHDALIKKGLIKEI